MLTRRTLCLSAATLAAARLLPAQPAPETARPDVAAIDRSHILATADHALTLKPANDLTAGAIPALTAATVLFRTADPARATTYAAAAAAHLRAFFVTPASRLNNQLTDTGNPEDLIALAPLAEIAVAIPFLEAQLTFPGSTTPDLLSPADLAATRSWCKELLTQLNRSRIGILAKDRKDHVGGAWLLLAAACARLTADDPALAALRHQFKAVTLRAQILADGSLPHELSSPTPYRNSLFAIDLLAAACDLLSTRFETLWDFQLQDGPGLRALLARHAPFMASRNTWTYPADPTTFHDLPCRRPALLLAARAFSRPDYAALWRTTTPPEPTKPDLLAAFPLRQPLLWVTRPRP